MSEPRFKPVLNSLDLFAASGLLPQGPETACPYLPGRVARIEGLTTGRPDNDSLAMLLNHGFRRSGSLFYRPRCPSCQACRPLRVPVDRFAPSRSQRRVWRRNADVRGEVGRPHWSREKWELYRAYLNERHDRSMSRAQKSLKEHLYDSPVDSLEITYHASDRLLGVSIVDATAELMSSVYMYFDPAEARRSLGTFSVLWEIELCRRLEIPYYHLGFWVRGSRTMDYKSRFRPCEVLDETLVRDTLVRDSISHQRPDSISQQRQRWVHRWVPIEAWEASHGPGPESVSC